MTHTQRHTDDQTNAWVRGLTDSELVEQLEVIIDWLVKDAGLTRTAALLQEAAKRVQVSR